MWQIWWFKLKPSWRVISSASLVLYRCCCIQGFSLAAWWEQCFHFDRADLSINDFPVFQQLEALWFSTCNYIQFPNGLPPPPNRCHSSQNLVWRNLLCFCVHLSTNVISFLVVSVRDSCNMPCLVGFCNQDLIAVMVKQKAAEKFQGELLSECFFLRSRKVWF